MRAALANGGGWVAACAVILAFVLAAYAFNPVEEAEDHVAEPVGKSLGFVDSYCPEGWKDTSSRDEHTKVFSCSKGSWIVFLDEDGKFDHAWDQRSPDFEFSPVKVPEWR